MSRLRWWARSAVRALRWHGLVGLVLITATAVVYAVGVAPAKARIAQLQQEALSVREFARAKETGAQQDEVAQMSRLERFYRLLPVRSSAPEWLRVVFDAARERSLILSQGDYKMKVDKNGRLITYEIGLPVHGSYPQIRQFVGDVLHRIPALALEELVIKRDTIGDPAIDASIRFTLFLNGN